MAELIRLNKVLRELNLSMERAIEFLESKGIEIESSPSTKISEEVHQILSDEFEIKTKHQKIAGSRTSGNSIDLTKFKRPEKKKRRKISSKLDKTLSDLSQLKIIKDQDKNDIIQELKDFWEIDKFRFIASVAQYNNNTQYLRNIRKETGEKLIDPNGKWVTITVPKGTELNINNEYVIEVFLAPDGVRKKSGNKYMLFLDTKKNPPKRFSIPKKDYVNQIRSDIEGAKGALKDYTLGSIERIIAETNKKPETFIYELIQNADDYPDPNKSSVHVSFNITHDHLVLTHDGLPFQQKNVYAISIVNARDKSDDPNKTGYKGMGFKSIFRFSDHVWINSGGYSFRFDRKYFDKKGIEMPWQIIPIWTAPKDLDDETKKLLEAPVSIFIRPSDGKTKLNEIDHIFNTIFKNDDRVLLFLRKVSSLSFKHNNSEFTIKKDDSKWEVSDLSSVSISPEVKNKLSAAVDKDDRIPEKFKNISISKITFATLKNNGNINKTKDTLLYAYLPTDWNFGFDFLINGDFIPDGSRDRLFDDIEWNLYLFEQAGAKFLEWVKELAIKFEGSSPYSIIPNLNRLIDFENDRAKKVFLEKFKNGFNTGIKEIDFLRSRKGIYHRLKELVIDKTGIADTISVEIIHKLISESQEILCPKLAKIAEIRSMYNEYGEHNQFDWVNLKRRIHSLNEWLQTPNNNATFLNFLIDNKKTEEFTDIKIILDQNNNLKCFKDVFFEVPEDHTKLLSFVEYSFIHNDVKKALVNFRELPLLNYDVELFIKEYILKNKSEVDNKISVFNSSNDFYNYLSINQKEISERTINELKWFQFFDNKKELQSSIENSNIYFDSETIINLCENKIVPKDQIIRLPKEYINHSNGKDLWERLGTKVLVPDGITLFIKEEFCDNLKEINNHLQNLSDEDANLYHNAVDTLIEFLSDNVNRLTENLIEYLQQLKLFILNESLKNSISEMTIYFNEERLNELLSSNCFPEGHFYILPTSYSDSLAMSSFWKVLGVKDINNDNLFDFFKKEIIGCIDAINKHIDSIFSNDKEKAILISTNLLEFYFKSKAFLSPTDLSLVQAEMSKVYVLTSTEELVAIKECFIPSHYTGKSEIEDLIDSFDNIELSFISKKFSNNSVLSVKDWKNIFFTLGAKNENLEFIKNILLPDIEKISNDSIISATKLLFENRKLLKEQIKGIDDFPIKKSDETIAKASEVALGNYFLAEGNTKSFTEQFEFDNEISSEYTVDKIDSWKNFFIELGVPKIDDDSLISRAIKILIENTEEYEEDEKHIKLLDSLLNLHKEELLTPTNYKALQSWRLKCKSNKDEVIHYKEAKSILLSNSYKPKIKFEDYFFETELNFLDDTYLMDFNDSNLLISFFKEIGVCDSFIYNKIDEKSRVELPVAYIEWIDKKYQSIAKSALADPSSHKVRPWIEVPFLNLIREPKLNGTFWDLVKDNERFKNMIFNTISYKKHQISESVESEPLWFVRSNKTVSNLEGKLCCPHELFNLSLKDIIKNNELIASQDFEEIECNAFDNLAEAIALKTELDLITCLSILIRHESHNWLKTHNIFSRLEELIDIGLTDNEQVSLEDFQRNGELLSQTLQWMPLDKLHVVDSSFKLGITKSENLLHPDFNGISGNFKVKILGKDDFKFETTGKKEDKHLNNILNSRIKYLAFLMNEDTWKGDLPILNSEIQNLTFFTCKKISQSYRNEDILIENSDFGFYFLEDKDEFYYIGKWDRVRAADMYPRLYKRLELKDPVSEKVFKDILFAETTDDIIEYFEENKIELPDELNSKAQIKEQEKSSIIEEAVPNDIEDEVIVNDNETVIEERSNNEGSDKETVDELEKNDETDDVENPVIQENFKKEVSDFLVELQNTSWSSYIPELKQLLLGIDQTEQRQKLFNIMAKLKLGLQIGAKNDEINDYNKLIVDNDKYIVHSARGPFAYIHPNEILEMNEEGAFMALDWGANDLSIYKTAAEILHKNDVQLLRYSGDQSIDRLINFCKENKGEKRHLLFVDGGVEINRNKDLLKFLVDQHEY